MVLLVILLSILGVKSTSAFDCQDAVENSLGNDDQLHENLKENPAQASVGCLASLLRVNYFKSAELVVDALDSEALDKAIESAVEAAGQV